MSESTQPESAASTQATQNAEEQKEASKTYLDEVTGEHVSKNELKKRQKARAKAEKDAQKAKEKAEAAAAKGGEAKTKRAAFDEDVDPSKYTDNRKNFVQALRDQGVNPYPHKFTRTHRIDQFR